MTTKKLIRHYHIDWESSGYIGSLNKSCWYLEGTFRVNHWINNITSLTGNWSTKLTSYEDSFKIPISFEKFKLLFSPLLFPFTTLLTVAHAIVAWLTKNNLKHFCMIPSFSKTWNLFNLWKDFDIKLNLASRQNSMSHNSGYFTGNQNEKIANLRKKDKKNKRTKVNANKMPGNIICI